MDQIIVSLALFTVYYGNKWGTVEFPENLNTLTIRSDDNYWKYIFLEKLPLDAWGRTFIYTRLDKKSYELISYGKDGLIGGKGEDEDLKHEFSLIH